MDAASSNSSKPQIFSVMSCIPQQLNRDKVISMISSISKVVSFNIIRIACRSGEHHRIGVARVADQESIYRLTSRRFLVGPNQPIKFCQVPEDSKLFRHSVGQEIQLRLMFSSPEKTFFHKVVDFVNKIGPAKMVAMKGHTSQSELLFKVPANFSLKQHSTELSLDICGCTVSAHYAEECFSSDYFGQELTMIKELIGNNASDLPVEVSEKALFFQPHQQSLGSLASRASEYQLFPHQSRKVALFEKTYDIVEDDLSESEDAVELEKGCEFEQVFRPFESENEGHNGICFFKKDIDFGFFTEKSLFMSIPESAEGTQDPEPRQMSGALLQCSEKDPVGKRNIFGSDAHTYSSNGSSYQNLIGIHGTPTFGGCLSHRDTSFHWKDQALAPSQNSKRFRPIAKTAAETFQGPDFKHSKNESTDLANHKSQTSRRIRPSNKLRGDRTKGRAQEEHSSSKKGAGRQAPNILNRISPAASDLVELNDKYMPQIKEVWRRFWMIKNEIKKEKKIEEEAKKNSTGNKPSQSSYGLHLDQSDPILSSSNTGSVQLKLKNLQQ